MSRRRRAKPGRRQKTVGAVAVPGEPTALRQIREAAAALLAEGHTDEALDYSLAALAAVLRKNTELEQLLAKLRRAGTRSERIAPEQLALLLEALQQLVGGEGEGKGKVEERDPVEEAREDALITDEIEREEAGAAGGKEAARRHGGRSWRTREVERRVHRVEVPEPERVCGRCGGAKRRMGEDVTHTLTYVPAHFVEHEYRLEKYACGVCKDAVSTAAGPVRVIDRSVADASVLAHVVVSKYVDHTPLHRLQRVYARSGVTIPVSTLADWTAGVAERIEPLVAVLEDRMLAAHLVRTDATGLKVLDPNSAANIERGTMWCCVGDEQDVVFRYTPTGEGASGPWSFLAGRSGYIQADAASVFDRLFNGQAATAIEVGCWAHARRKYEALAGTDCRVAYPLQLIARLYRLEHLADVKGLDPADRALQRQQRSRPVLEKLKRWLLAIVQREPPASEFAKAASYTLNHWQALNRFCEDGRLDLDNNLCERQLRDIALGRKNYLFAGSHAAARRTARLYSLMRTCAQHRVPPLPYLTDVLRKLAGGWPKSRLAELLPDEWQLAQDIVPEQAEASALPTARVLVPT